MSVLAVPASGPLWVRLSPGGLIGKDRAEKESGIFAGTLDIHEPPEIAKDRFQKILGQPSASS